MAGQSNTVQQQDTLNRYLLYFPEIKPFYLMFIRLAGKKNSVSPTVIPFASPVQTEHCS
jgi:hypothetical protein